MARQVRIALLVVLLLTSLDAHATNVRGQILFFNRFYQQVQPANGIQINVSAFNPAIGRWVMVAQTFSQPDGMYYFVLAPGNYYFYIPATNQNFPIVIAPQYYQDIPPIQLP